MGEFIVVGGGVTGLAAAWELVTAGHMVSVLESGDRFGGKVQTSEVAGYAIEQGPDSVVSYRPAALDLARELGMAAEIVAVQEPRSVQLRVGGTMRPMPASMGLVLPTKLRPFLTTRVLDWPAKLRAGADLVLPRSLPAQDTSIGTLLRHRLGPAVVDRIAEPLLGGVYGASVDELSLDAVVPTLREAEQKHRSLLLASLAQGRRATAPGKPGSPFRSLRSGMGSLTDALQRELTAAGARLLPNWQVTSLRCTADGWQVQGRDWPAAHAQGVILAVGPKVAAELLGELAPDAAAALTAIPLGSSTSVALGFDRSAFEVQPVGHGHLEAGPGPAPISGVTLSSNKWPNRAPADKVLLRAFVPDRVGPIANAQEADLVRAVTEHVCRVYRIHGQPELVQTRRWRHSMPKYVVGHRALVERVTAGTGRYSGLAVAGSALHGVGVPDCVSSGRATARSVADSVTAQL